jgi:hypothetical protein
MMPGAVGVCDGSWSDSATINKSSQSDKKSVARSLVVSHPCPYGRTFLLQVQDKLGIGSCKKVTVHAC